MELTYKLKKNKYQNGSDIKLDLKKKNIVIAIMVAMFLGAVEGTIVTTAVPTIVKDLNGFSLISWVFSAYLFTSAISTPIYGKLSDLYGRRDVLCIGIIIFLIGSSLCGVSRNMYELIAFRALQGIGSGAIFTVTYTIVGDIFDISERAKVQGWLSTVWGISSLVGPFLGGFLIDTLSWHWVFFINLPFGIISIILLQKNLKEKPRDKTLNISMDFGGIIVLSFAIVSLLYCVLYGQKHSFYSSYVLITFLCAITLLFIFYFVERKVKQPIMPFEIFTKTNTVDNIISFLASASLMGLDVYMPVYLQNVLGFNATISGLSMAPMSVAWLIAAVVLSNAIIKYGEGNVIIVSSAVLLISMLFLPTLTISSPLILVIIYVSMMGFGFGGLLTILTIIIQESVDYGNRGAAMACNSLLRTLGQTIGVSILGGIFNLSMSKNLSNFKIRNIDINNIYSSMNLKDAAYISHVKMSINSGLHSVFISLIVLSIFCFLLSFMLPNNLKNKK